MSQTCLICGGTRRTVDGNPCPECCKNEPTPAPVVSGIPIQYQGVRFDKSFLPNSLQDKYGSFMEDLLDTIINDIAFYQKNMIICCRPNSGKTIWAYNLMANLIAKGYETLPLLDLMEARDAMNSFEDREMSRLISTARCAVIKIPLDVQYWMLNSISSLVERRVRNGGFTIFIYGGTIEDLNRIDKNNVLSSLRGAGAYNTVKVEAF